MSIDSGLLSRRATLVTSAALLLFLAAASPAAAADARLLQGLPITFVEPYGPHSVTNIPLMLMRGEIGGERADLLGAVQPVAKLSAGISAALIVPEASPIRNIDDFLAQARSRRLRLVHLGRTAAFGLELAMLEKKFGLSFTDKVVGTRAQILEALASGEADAGFLTTITLLPSADATPPPVRPLLTFGAQRNPKLPSVPTFKERSGEPKGSVTTAISMFAPRTLR